MKPILYATAALIIGVIIGSVLTQREFARDAAVVHVQLTSSGQPVPATSSETVSGPKVNVVNGERHNFGTMDRNAHGSHVFLVRNDGDAPLALQKGNSTCKCTVGELGKDKLDPGETAEIKLEWNAETTGHQFEQSVQIITNDRERPSLYLSVVGEVIDAVRAFSEEIHFNDASRNEPTSVTVPIFAYRGPPLEIENVELMNKAQADMFQVSFEPLTEEELAHQPKATSGLKMVVVLAAGQEVGRLDQRIQLTTNIRPEHPLEIRVVGNVASDILLAGPRTVSDRKLVLLPPVERAEGRKHTVYLVVKGPYRDETELRIASVEPAVEFAATLGEPQRDNPRTVRFPLTIEIPPNATPVSRMADGSEAIITISSTHPDEKELVVKVRYLVKVD